MIDLTGRTALVTGASRGIGAATAKVLDRAGARVVLSGRTAPDLDEVASRNDHITPASQLGQDQQDGPRAGIHGDRVQSRYVKRGVRGCKRIQNRAGKVSVSRPAVTRVQIQFNVDVATRKVSNCIRGIGSERCPAEVGMQHHAGRVDHPTRPASIDRDRRRQRCLDRLAKQSHTTRVAGAALDHRRLVSDEIGRAHV